MLDLRALLTTFGLVFVAELGDKTQLAVVTQTCRLKRPLSVFLGASLALTAVTGLGAAGGHLLTYAIPREAVRGVAAALFLVMGVVVWWRGRSSPGGLGADAGGAACNTDQGAAARGLWDWQAFGSTLALVFVAELGDKTQLAVFGLASESASAWGVFAGGALALVSVTALGVLSGERIARLLPKQALLRISAGAFVVMGVLMGLGIS
jgi:putative Ca2+/H+ antiporter (TMEM165/GDT1 family)